MNLEKKIAVLALLMVARLCAPAPFCEQISDLARDVKLFAGER